MEKHTALETSQLDAGLESELAGSIDRTAHLTREETRQIVTPYAFFVADELLGTPLAGPFRRGFGLLIDLFFIALLTQVSSLFLAAVAAWTFFRAGNRLKTKKRFNGARIFLRLLVALLLFVVAMGIVDMINEDNPAVRNSSNASVNTDNAVDGITIVALTAKYLLKIKAIKQHVAQGECEQAYDCLQILGEELVQDIVDIGLDRDAIEGVMEGYLDSVSENLSAEQQTELTTHLQQFVETKQTTKNSPEQVTAEQTTVEQTFAHSSIEQSPIKPVENNSKNDKSYTQSKGFIKWLENLVEELGLGFGWAAFYFSIFTAWWKGQTPGKKMMGMKVIKLDNTPLNLWESFGRYGGYAAGFATGLTGFLQVFWDPNRQAIQDKISETLVIDLRKPKVPFIKETAA
ncbi:RDD family protein [Paraglaciecola sp. MB-3u-78]|jgi:hypothetical protein|uniref:RDD family protein n=1 Tax=Paraglaciecola sp. MB-3u-78 TaxID=2058332 RepID=UPI000C34EB19|nr:RDD family protein [Paraglaciecola sp. MB-3u-78]PKG99658.1 RDD family protein [Paraglaciecola sp. MB-3u-78]